MNKTTTEKMISTAISNLCIPILRKYSDKILGIYLSPYSIGGKQKIDVVITKSNNDELNIDKKKTNVNQLEIFISEESIDNYKKSPKTDYEYKLSKDLKTGIIIYDPNNKLSNKKNNINTNSEITPFYNTFELPNSLTTIVKSKVYSYKKNKKKSKN